MMGGAMRGQCNNPCPGSLQQECRDNVGTEP